MVSYEQIVYDVHGAAAIITFNRPDKLNAWTPLMEAEVGDAVATANASGDVQVIIFTGAGRGFCAGADLSGPRPPAESRPGPDRFAFLWNSKKLLVAAVNGPAAGVGLSIALYCDLRYMAEGASVTTAFARRGLIAEHGSAWLLPRLIGIQNATDLLISGRRVDAAEAAAMGLARLVPDDGFIEAVRETVSALVAPCSPRSIRVIRRQIRQALHQGFEEAIAAAHREQLASLESADFQEGVAAFRERRPAKFPGD